MIDVDRKEGGCMEGKGKRGQNRAKKHKKLREWVREIGIAKLKNKQKAGLGTQGFESVV